MKVLQIHERDNVAVAIEPLVQGERLTAGAVSVQAAQAVDKGHKIALTPITRGENIIKYGFPIGHALEDIPAGAWVHTHNVKTNLGETLEYEYQPGAVAPSAACGLETFRGYRRPSGRVGVRNEIWIIPTVSCVNRPAEIAAKLAQERYSLENIDGIFEFKHPYGCSQMGDDQLNTQRILANLVNHPNAGGVLVLGLGCENNNIGEFQKVLGSYDPARVKFLAAQDVEDEIEAAVEAIGQLIDHAKQYQRQECPASELAIGLKCGGSDGFSGITANPLVGYLSDRLVACGGSSILTEVPEMFGAEILLMNRAVSREVFDKTVNLVNGFKQYFQSYNQVIYENPSPGNKKGGITTLEDKSLGCTQKGGTSQVVDVLDYGQTLRKKGLNLLNGPGNDMVAATVLAAAGCQMVLFTTGRGTPLGTAVPTVKIATNSDLFRRKPAWMDFDAGRLLREPREQVTDDFFAYCLAVASGQKTKAETMGFREIAIFKNGVTL
ncbi:UxaA family hydrolase [Acetonema longum]|uniref:Altronate hydrolase n=1 Tax=Acetonema longum DSM 6540 TaxID=1009370 RepID=F7NFY0_9FIRM|nr:altronate dehydratase family protein [Acetonema longum]EGO65043.1 altronate hydrolase [Acetonema longum DSM 6540]